MKTNGGPAFPVSRELVEMKDYPFKVLEGGAPGMSLRDYFAAAVLQGVCSSPDVLVGIRHQAQEEKVATEDALASICYKQADAMLAEREKP